MLFGLIMVGVLIVGIVFGVRFVKSKLVFKLYIMLSGWVVGLIVLLIHK